SASIKGGFVERFDGDAPSASVTITYQRNQIPSSYFETQLLNDLSVAVLRSALLRELREEMSKVYSVAVSGSFALHPDTLARTTIQFNCDTEDVELLIKTVSTRLSQMANNPASIEKLLADVKNNMRKEHTLDIQKDAFWGSYIRNSIFNGEESFYFVQHFDQMLDAITANDLARFIKTQLLDQQPVIGILHPKTANKTN